MEELSVSELAERIAPAGDKAAVERITRQLRHWTLNHVLEPAGGLHTGPGRHRRYSSESIYMAALIAELSSMGFPIGVLWAVATAAKFGLANHKLWRRAVEGKGTVLLHFAPRLDEAQHLSTPMGLHLVDQEVRFSDLDHCGHVVVNLSRLFAPLRA